MKAYHHRHRSLLEFSALILVVLIMSSFSVEGFQVGGAAWTNKLPTTPRSVDNLLMFDPRGGGGARKHSVFLSLSSESGDEAKKRFDFAAVGKWGAALGIQMGLLGTLFAAMDRFLPFQVPFAVNIFFFYALALKSRILNPLSNQRPQPKTKEIDGSAPQRKMPTWTPPGFIFPIVWLLLIGPLRATTSAMIVKTTGTYANRAILSLMLHLSIGDIWNTINNVERRYGTSVLGVLCVWASAAFAARQYYQVLPLAGKLLSLKLIWLTIASSLIVRTWQLNPDLKTDKPYSLLPMTGEGNAKTTLVWFEKGE